MAPAFFYTLRSPRVIEFAWRQARGTSYEPRVIRWQLSVHGGPVPKALADGRIFLGQPVAEVEAEYGPFRKTSFDRYTELEPPGDYVLLFEGYRMFARDGKLVGAGWGTCTGSVEFFNAMTPADWDDWHRAFVAYRTQLHDARRDAHMAVVSPAMWWGDKLWDDYRRSAEPNAQMAVAGPLGYVAHGSLPPLPDGP